MNQNHRIVRNLPNIITWFGILLCVGLLLVVVLHRDWVAIILSFSVVILITDLLDGIIARKFNATSKYGAALDRVRDKFFQLTMFSFFVSDPRIDDWLKFSVYPLIIIEVLLLGIWVLGVRKKLDVSAGIWGKAKMFLVSVGIIALPLMLMAQEHSIAMPAIVIDILILVFVVSLWLGVMSFINHVRQYRAQA